MTLELKNDRNNQIGFIPINDVFSYGIENQTVHIHIPYRIDKKIKEKGLKYTIEYINENLFDALQKLLEVSKKNTEIRKIFAVSPLLSQPIFRERLEVLGFKTEPADKKFEKFFQNKKNLTQASIPIERLKRVLEIEKEMRDDMDKNGELWHEKILYYKYKKLKEIGIIDYYDIPLDSIIKMGKMNYNYRHGLSLETKENRNMQFDQREDVYKRVKKMQNQDEIER